MPSKLGAGESDGVVGAEHMDTSLSSASCLIGDRFRGDASFTGVRDRTTISLISLTVVGDGNETSAISSDTVRLRTPTLVFGALLRGAFSAAASAFAVLAFRVWGFDTCMIFLGESGDPFGAVALVRRIGLVSTVVSSCATSFFFTSTFFARVALGAMVCCASGCDLDEASLLVRLAGFSVGFFPVSARSTCSSSTSGSGASAAFLPLVALGFVSGASFFAVARLTGFFLRVLPASG